MLRAPLGQAMADQVVEAGNVEGPLGQAIPNQGVEVSEAEVTPTGVSYEDYLQTLGPTEKTKEIDHLANSPYESDRNLARVFKRKSNC